MATVPPASGQVESSMPLAAPVPTPGTGIPASVIANAQSVLNQVQNVAHASVAALSSVVLVVESLTEVLHKAGVNTSGADMRLVGISGGLLIASKTVDSVSWSSILRIFGR